MYQDSLYRYLFLRIPPSGSFGWMQLVTLGWSHARSTQKPQNTRNRLLITLRKKGKDRQKLRDTKESYEQNKNSNAYPTHPLLKHISSSSLILNRWTRDGRRSVGDLRSVSIHIVAIFAAVVSTAVCAKLYRVWVESIVGEILLVHSVVVVALY